MDHFKSNSSDTTYERHYKLLIDHYDACRSSIARDKASSLTPENRQGISSGNINKNSGPKLDDFHWCLKRVVKNKVDICSGCGRGVALGIDFVTVLSTVVSIFSGRQMKDISALRSKAQHCPIHLVGSNIFFACNAADFDKSIRGINGCTRHRYKSLHGGTSSILTSVLATDSTSSSISEADNVFLSMQTIQPW